MIVELQYQTTPLAKFVYTSDSKSCEVIHYQLVSNGDFKGSQAMMSFDPLASKSYQTLG